MSEVLSGAVLRPEEMEYWDRVAEERCKKGIKDNTWKRAEIVSRVLAHRPHSARILEIGVGQGLVAAAVNLTLMGYINYTGTDCSRVFADFTEQTWRLKTVVTDIRTLPDGPYDMIWAFDSFEHIRPEDREAGWRELARVIEKPALIMINNPLDESQHDPEFDWELDMADVQNLCTAVEGYVSKCDGYYLEEIQRWYQWIEVAVMP